MEMKPTPINVIFHCKECQERYPAAFMDYIREFTAQFQYTTETYLLIYETKTVNEFLDYLQQLERENRLPTTDAVDEIFISKQRIFAAQGYSFFESEPFLLIAKSTSSVLTVFHELMHAVLRKNYPEIRRAAEFLCEYTALRFFYSHPSTSETFDVGKHAVDNLLTPDYFQTVFKETQTESSGGISFSRSYNCTDAFFSMFFAAWRFTLDSRLDDKIFQQGWKVISSGLQGEKDTLADFQAVKDILLSGHLEDYDALEHKIKTVYERQDELKLSPEK